MNRIKKIFDLDYRPVRLLAQFAFFVLLIAFFLRLVAGFAIPFSTTVLESGCVITNDDFAVIVVCNHRNQLLKITEFVLNIPFFITTSAWVIPMFFGYGILGILDPSLGDYEPLLTAIVFPITIIIVYLEVLAIIFFFRILKKLLNGFRRN